MNTELAIQLVHEEYKPPEIATTERNRVTTKKYLLDSSTKVVGKYGDQPIYHTVEGEFHYYFCVNDGLIIYYMKCQVLNFPPIKHAACQVGVWRDIENQFMRRGDGPTLAATVFRTILLPKYKDVLSDKIQTVFGKLFWLDQIRWSFENSKYIYWLQLSGEDLGAAKEIKRIKDWEHFESLKDKTWGSSAAMQKVRLLISEQPVFFPDKETFKNQKKVLGIEKSKVKSLRDISSKDLLESSDRMVKRYSKLLSRLKDA